MPEALFDTSIFIAREHERPLGDVPATGGISVMTVAELQAGVLLALNATEKSRRMQTLRDVQKTYDPFPMDEDTAYHFANLVADAKRRRRRLNLIDLLIAATALRHDMVVYTQDESFRAIPAIEVVLV